MIGAARENAKDAEQAGLKDGASTPSQAPGPAHASSQEHAGVFGMDSKYSKQDPIGVAQQTREKHGGHAKAVLR